MDESINESDESNVHERKSEYERTLQEIFRKFRCFKTLVIENQSTTESLITLVHCVLKSSALCTLEIKDTYTNSDHKDEQFNLDNDFLEIFQNFGQGLEHLSFGESLSPYDTSLEPLFKLKNLKHLQINYLNSESLILLGTFSNNVSVITTFGHNHFLLFTKNSTDFVNSRYQSDKLVLFKIIFDKNCS